jgi:hypothetical protein
MLNIEIGMAAIFNVSVVGRQLLFLVTMKTVLNFLIL